MSQEVVFVECHFSKGGFPAEIMFQIKAPDGRYYASTAPAEYCLNPSRKRLDQGQLPMEGLLPAILLQRSGDLPEETERAYLPDGNVYDISRHLIQKADFPYVSV